MEQKQMKIMVVAAIVVVAAAALVVVLLPHLNLGGGGGDSYDEITMDEPYSVSASDYNRNEGFRASDGSMLWVFDKDRGSGLGSASRIDLGVSMGTSIPPVSGVSIPDGAKAFTIGFAHNGEFPNLATLSYRVGADYEGRTFSIYTLGAVNNLIGTSKVTEGMVSVNVQNDTPLLFVETPRVTLEPVAGCTYESASVSNGITAVVQYGSDVEVKIIADTGYTLVSYSVNGAPQVLPTGTTSEVVLLDDLSVDVIITVVVQQA